MKPRYEILAPAVSRGYIGSSGQGISIMIIKGIKLLNPNTGRYVQVTLLIDDARLATQLFQQTLAAQGTLSLRDGAIRVLAEEVGNAVRVPDASH